ncbi:MAG: hypothetical protein WC549_04665 [Actinomycetota bacterium]
MKKTIFFDNLGVKPRSPKARNLDFYLDMITERGYEFDRLEAYSTAGDIRPPYAYQWRALCKVRKGDDDAFEGLDGTPLKALRNLYKNVIKYGLLK